MTDYPIVLAIKEAGLDPNMILMRGLTPFWYCEFALDENGKRIVVDDELDYVAKWWPNPIVGFKIWLLWMKDERRWNV